MTDRGTFDRRGFLATLGCLLAGRAPAAGQALPRRIHALTDQVIAALDLTFGAVVSPLNLLEAVAPLVPAARGRARTALNQLFAGDPDAADPLAEAAALWRSLTPAGDGPSALSHAAALWLDAGSTASPRAVADLDQYLGVEVESLALREPDSVARINAWVSAKTAGIVPRVLDQVPDGAEAIITAALHFGARWTRAFNPALTQQAPFIRVTGGPARAMFMRTAAPVAMDFAEAGELIGIRLPYADPAFEFVAVVPRPGGNPGLLPGLAARGGLLATLEQMNFALRPNVELALPRVSVGQAADLLPLLRQGGLSDTFAPGADLSGLLGAPLRVAAVQSQTVLQWDETGTTAAAATAIVTERSMAMNRPVFRADMPFLGAVRHRDSGLIIVAALVNDPNRSST